MTPPVVSSLPKILTRVHAAPFVVGLFFLGIGLLPVVNPGNYWLHVCTLVFVYVALGLGLNIVVGLAGLLDLGFVAFYAVGAYSYALLTVHYPLPFIVILFTGAGLAALVGVVLGWPTIRAKGDYLALVTLAFGEMTRLVLRNADSVTNGPQGLMDLPAPSILGVRFTSPLQYYYLGLILGVCALALFWRVKNSAVGQQLIAIRDDEEAAATIGIHPVRWKLYAFALGAFVAGMAGVFFASWQRFVSPESFTLGESLLILCIVVLGGMGRVLPTVGAATFLVLLPEGLRGLERYRVLVLGVLLIAVVIFQEHLRKRAQWRRRDLPSALAHPQSARQTFTSDTSLQVSKSSDARVLLELSQVSKRFGGILALSRVCLRIHEGEIVGLVGANGAGKTTLIGCMAGTIHPDEGDIYLCETESRRAITHLAPYEVAERGLIRTFQQPRLFPSLTVLENVQLGARCHDTPWPWEPFVLSDGAQGKSQAAAMNLLDTLGLPLPELNAANLSFVDQKLVELARALAARPRLLLVDEPASGMEPTARRYLADLLRRANEEFGVTLLVVEHDLSFLKSICNRFVVIDRGTLVGDGVPADPTVVEALRHSYQLKRGIHGQG